MRKYGELPTSLGIQELICKEMMYYQYLPIKMSGAMEAVWESRLDPFSDLISKCIWDFAYYFGNDRLDASYVYLTVKNMYQLPGCSFNREGWHSDGFMSDDINYIWSDKYPTIFNKSNYNLTQDHKQSIIEMQEQSLPANNFTYKANELLRLDQYSVHKVAEITEPKMITFFKLSVSMEKYNLIGNSHNHLLNYEWDMKERGILRNHPVK